MTKNSFNYFKFECGLRYQTFSSNDIDSAFEKLVRLKEFDGVKKVTPKDKKIKLTSTDNRFTLTLSKKDLVVSSTNNELQPLSRVDLENVSRLTLEANQLLGEHSISEARVGFQTLTTSKKDKNYIATQLINSEFTSNLEDFNIELQFEDNDIDETIYVATSHTEEMHEAFERLGKKSSIGNITMVIEASGIQGDILNDEIERFFSKKIDDCENLRLLERLGYGEEE